MRITRGRRLAVSVLALGAFLGAAGCCNTPVNVSEREAGPAPLRFPSPEREGGCSYEDSLTGGQVFCMYCSYCHNAPSLAERPFSHYRNVAAHMRVRANLTGKEYAKLMAFLRRWHDIPPPSPPVAPTPNRLIFSQPISEQKKDDKKDMSGKDGDKGGPEVLPRPRPAGKTEKEKSASSPPGPDETLTPPAPGLVLPEVGTVPVDQTQRPPLACDPVLQGPGQK